MNRFSLISRIESEAVWGAFARGGTAAVEERQTATNSEQTPGTTRRRRMGTAVTRSVYTRLAAYALAEIGAEGGRNGAGHQRLFDRPAVFGRGGGAVSYTHLTLPT